MLKPIEILSVEDLDNPKFLKTQIVKYQREGEKPKLWEMAKVHDSVHVFVFNVETQEVLFVKQKRIPVLINDPISDGVVVECCAGIVDKDKTLIQIAKEEVLEELGYDVKDDDIIETASFKTNVGTTGSSVKTYYAEVTNEDKVNNGGGLPSEDIEVIYVPISSLGDFMNSGRVVTDPTTLYLVQAFVSAHQQRVITMLEDKLKGLENEAV